MCQFPPQCSLGQFLFHGNQMYKKNNVQSRQHCGELVDLLGRVQLDYGDLLKASDPVIQRKRIEPSS